MTTEAITSWQDLPRELQLMAFQYLDLPSLAKVCLVSKDIQQKARDDVVWQSLYLRDFHELHDDESGMEIDGTNKWQQRYRFAADLPKWDRENTTDVFILSDNDRLAQRNGSGAFPKAITAKPIGLSSRPIKIACMRSAEFGLFTADSPAELMEDLMAKARSSHWPSSYESFKKDCVIFSKMSPGFLIKLGNSTEKRPPPEGVTTDFTNTLTFSITIYQKRGEVLWDFAGHEAWTPIPPSPFYLAYSTGCGSGYAHILDDKAKAG